MMSFIHKYVSPVCNETHKVSEDTTLLTHISKNGGTTELIQICCGHDDITKMWAGFTLNSWKLPAHVPTYRSLSETSLCQKQCVTRFGSNMSCVSLLLTSIPASLTCVLVPPTRDAWRDARKPREVRRSKEMCFKSIETSFPRSVT